MTQRDTIQCGTHGRRPWSILCVHLAQPLDMLTPSLGFVREDPGDRVLARPVGMCTSCAARAAELTAHDFVAVCDDCWDTVARAVGGGA
jgi:hypothetical protein